MGFTVLLDRLSIGVGDVGSRNRWLRILQDVVQSPDGRRSLGYPHWELMLELSVTGVWFMTDPINYELQIMVLLEEEREWDRLGCWMGFVSLTRRPKINAIPEALECVALSLRNSDNWYGGRL